MSMQILDWNRLDGAGRSAALERPRLGARGDIDALALSIIREVRADGDAALKRFAARFDRVQLTDLRVPREEFDAAEKLLSAEQTAALVQAIANVRVFHAAQLSQVRVQHHPHAANRVDLRGDVYNRSEPSAGGHA